MIIILIVVDLNNLLFQKLKKMFLTLVGKLFVNEKTYSKNWL